MATYEIRFRGRVSRSLRDEFAQLDLSVGETVETVLYGPVEDQAALHGLLRRIEAIGLDLVDVRRVPRAPPGEPIAQRDTEGRQSSSS